MFTNQVKFFSFTQFLDRYNSISASEEQIYSRALCIFSDRQTAFWSCFYCLLSQNVFFKQM